MRILSRKTVGVAVMLATCPIIHGLAAGGSHAFYAKKSFDTATEYPHVKGGGISGLPTDNIYVIPKLLSDFLQPDGFMFRDNDLQAAIDQTEAAPGGGFLLVQTRLPVVAHKTVTLTTAAVSGLSIVGGEPFEGAALLLIHRTKS